MMAQTARPLTDRDTAAGPLPSFRAWRDGSRPFDEDAFLAEIQAYRNKLMDAAEARGRVAANRMSDTDQLILAFLVASA